MMENKECENYKNGICIITGAKCKGIDDGDCMADWGYYDPWLAGECEDF